MPLASVATMLCRSYGAGIEGVEGYVVTVEAEVGDGLPCLVIVGQASGALQEARERVKAALGHTGHAINPRKQIVNLAPADRRKDSPGLDLAIACGLLAAHGVLEPEMLKDTMFWAELGLDGILRPAAGGLVVADAARQAGFRRVVVAPPAAAEAALIEGLEVIPAPNLGVLVRHLRGEVLLDPEPPPADDAGSGIVHEVDMADVRGLTVPRLALEVMVAGGHNLLMYGPPGVGKTMLARRAATLFPPLARADALEVTKIHGVASGRPPDGLIRRVPIRMPHHTVSAAGLLGGGSPPRAGEVSLAHRGLLFLDELPEFPRHALEGLREPLEDGQVRLVRARHSVRFPARFQLMAAMNPCPCGYLGHPERACVDPPSAVARYQARISGPFMDRMDLVIPIHPLDPKTLSRAKPGESSAVIRERILQARAVQAERLRDTPWSMNSQIPAIARAMERLCPLQPPARAMLEDLARERALSPRAQHRMRRVARTLADLRGAEGDVALRFVAEAAHLRRPMDAGH